MAHFAIDVTAWAKKAEGKLDLVVRKVAFDLFTRVLLRTPVLHGILVANWMMAIGHAPLGFDPEKKDPGKGGVINDAVAITNQAKAGDTIFLINHAPYAMDIEHGYSRVKAPQGMVNVTLTEFQSIVNGAASEVK